MILQVFSIRDRASDSYGAPFYMASPGAAMRAFSDLINSDSKDLASKHPDDFDLYALGSFDDTTAVFSLLEHPRQVCLGRDLKRVQSPTG